MCVGISREAALAPIHGTRVCSVSRVCLDSSLRHSSMLSMSYGGEVQALADYMLNHLESMLASRQVTTPHLRLYVAEMYP
jgi:hypothetical protein